MNFIINLMTKLDLEITDKNNKAVELDLDGNKNNSILIVGRTGSGKTRLVKKILPKISTDSALFVINSDADFEDVSNIPNITSIDIKDGVPEFGDRVVLNDPISKETRQYVYETLEQVWQRANTLPAKQEKIIILDGFLRFVETKAFENILRMGRKLNIKVILTLQSFEGVEEERFELFQNFDTRIILNVFDDNRARIIKAGIADEGDFVEEQRSGVIITSEGKTAVDFS